MKFLRWATAILAVAWALKFGGEPPEPEPQGFEIIEPADEPAAVDPEPTHEHTCDLFCPQCGRETTYSWNGPRPYRIVCKACKGVLRATRCN